MDNNSSNNTVVNPTFITKAVVLVCLLILIPGLFLFFFRDRIYPGVSVANVNLSALSRDQALYKLEQIYSNRENKTFEFSYQDASTSSTQKFSINLKGTTQVDFEKTLDNAFAYGRSKLFLKPKQLNLEIEFNSNLDNQIKQIAQIIDIPSIDSQLKIDSEITATPSQDGIVLDQTTLKQDLKNYLNSGYSSFENLPLKVTKPKLDYQSALRIKNRLDQLKVSPLTLRYKDQEFTLGIDTILSLISLEKSDSQVASINIFNTPVNLISAKVGQTEVADSKITFNQAAVKSYLEKQIAPKINRQVEEPLFQFDGKKVTEFRPPQVGRQLDIEQSSKVLGQALGTEKQTNVDLAVNETTPKNKLVNDLGIKELIGSGASNFAGSIENRIYNIGLAASRINGVLIAPGEEFSFDQTIGDITAATGYKQAYVIQSGRTVLGDGGGVCQVSTTLFRAILNAGMPITARTPHAYRVSYYEQGYPPGLDATIFYPSVDLKFKNDTKNYILIQASVSGTSLYVNLYGTSDGRISKVSTPQITSQTPPPPDLRQDDPTLPRGTVKQVDFAAWGANVVFTRTVTRDGQTIISDTFRSSYRPWQAVYLVGTGG